MKKQNLDNILSRLKSGKSISTDEKEYILYKLQSFDDSGDLASAIRAFGLSNKANAENIQRIETYLFDLNSDDIVRSYAIKTLCYDWGLTVNYIEKLKVFLKKEDAYNFSECQIIIFSAFGTYLNNTSDVKLFRFLYNLFVKELEEFKKDEDDFQGGRLEDIYQSLDVGLRGRKAEIEHAISRKSIPESIDENIIADVLKLINNDK